MHSPISFLIIAVIAATNISAAPQLKPDALPRAAACPSMIMVFARGTTETGALGTIVGPPLQASLDAQLGKGAATVMGVPAPAYAADIPGFLAGGSSSGTKAMAQMAQTQMQGCPNSTVALAGYSQGGQLVHNAAKMLPAATTSKMMAVIFGDPDNGTAVAGVSDANTLVVCHDGDNICEHGDAILPAHLTYGADTGKAAKFVASRMNAGVAKA